MKIEKLDHKKKKYFLYALGVLALFLAILEISTSLAKYKTTQSVNIVKGTVSYSQGDLNLMAIYVAGSNGYEQQDIIPLSGYILNNEESYCKLGDERLNVTINYDVDTQALTILPLTNKGTKCYLYFDVYVPSAKEIILADKTISTRSDFSTIYTTITTNTIFSAEDDDGTSYYFAGAPTDNWVKFAGFYWRIIRINGDGTIRLIYNGTSTSTTGEGTQIGISAFNTSYGDNAYVGYMYTTGSLRGTGTSSTIKGVLDDWYDSKLASYASYIDTNAGFCGDRTPSTSSSSINGSGGTGTTQNYYGDYVRYWGGAGDPTLKCANSSDLYTKSGASKGNKALTKPIGLINMNEVWLAGGYQASNSSYYLYTGQNYWTMSPFSFNGSHAFVFYVDSVGRMIVNNNVSWNLPGVRPVINLKADTQFKLGSLGTAESPFEVI